jgi:hypothetical protein
MRVPVFLIVCASLAIIVPAFALETTLQPLTRADCKKAGMQWNDNANVCGGKEAATKPEAKPEKSKKKHQ